MKPWEISKDFVDRVIENHRQQDETYYCAMSLGTLKSVLGDIMIDLNIYFPDAYEKIKQKLIDTQ